MRLLGTALTVRSCSNPPSNGDQRGFFLESYRTNVCSQHGVREAFVQDNHSRCIREGVDPRPYHETEFWHPDSLPGKRGFDLARGARQRVESVVADFMTATSPRSPLQRRALPRRALPHAGPLNALRGVATVTGERAVVEPRPSSFPASHTRRCGASSRAPSSTATSRTRGAKRQGADGRAAAGGLRLGAATHGPPGELLDEPGGPHHYRLAAEAAK